MKYKNPTPAKVKVSRAELRNRKIILVLEPDLLSNEVFAPNAFYDEGDEKNQLKSVSFSVNITEEKGEINVYSCNYTGTATTKSHRQLSPLSLFITKKDKALNEVLNCRVEFIEDEERMSKLISNWNDDPEFKTHLLTLIEKRKLAQKKEHLKKAIEAYEIARKRLESLTSIGL